MTTVRLFNTLTRKKEELRPLKPPAVSLYTCGPTVYNFAHIGNFRTYIFEDLLRRTLTFFGYQVTQVMNLTDVDDKTMCGACEKGLTLEEFTEPFKKAFFEDLETLSIERAEHYPAATAYFQEMFGLIQILLEKGVAYRGDEGSIYYAIDKFPSYGKLSHLKLDELKVGASTRVQHDEYDKENASDFVLWKVYEPERDGPIFWDSPFGPGRPGWHLECSAMAMSLLGPSIDIHCGGIDNMFPHHENEIAQSEACTGKAFVGMWLHAEHLIVDGKKMSKSAGNFFTLRDLLAKGYTGKEVRFMLLHTHYKTQLNFTMSGLDGARSSLARINDFIHRLGIQQGETPFGDAAPLLEKADVHFKEALADDLNISLALAALFDIIRDLNILCDKGRLSHREAEETLALLRRWNGVLDIMNFDSQAEIPHELQGALEERLAARRAKDWKRADEIRDLIASHGFVIEDTPSGSVLKKVH